MNSRPTMGSLWRQLHGLKEETVIHTEAVNSHSGLGDSNILLAGIWVVAGLILVGMGIALHGHSGTLLAWIDRRKM
ncbi:hypothetical protein [Leptospirillum ferrooxidans]|uniref:Uncharacterized protein n=1 Tax=Leptospirillum ferrooxidans (strain C2-3) TaxID=1162668 RepID=I0ILU2_LEPFC|nr:hypothetical protein [Leptospirillum ferrooxidans]BAM06241.1 hypothetical protein LFE_0524 [Leptospirillum ferrooxidans C2-3]